MAYQISAGTNILYSAAPGSYDVFPATITNDGISANADGRKIVPAGTAVESAESGTFRASFDKVKACVTANDAEGILFSDVDVTDGDAVGAVLTRGVVDGSKLESMPTGAGAILKAFGIFIIGTHTEA